MPAIAPAALAAAAAANCTPASPKVDCGYYGIDKDGCIAKGCCWVPVDPNPSNDPWCISAAAGPPSPPAPPTPSPPGPTPPGPVPVPPGQTCDLINPDKVDCHHDESSCESNGCCWQPVNPNPSNYPWCFHAAMPPAPTPAPPPTPPPPPPPPPGAAPFTDAELATMEGFFFKNVDLFGTGMVVAAPDNNTAGGTYWYHWMRDGGLTMRSVLENFAWARADPLMRSYVTHVKQAQTESDPNGIDVRGEPKFMIPSGAVFSSGWCRPQNDGAGIRGGTLALYAMALLDKGEEAYVREHLWTGDPSKNNGGLVKYDLDYCMQVWHLEGCDLWEEVKAKDFYWNYAHDRRGLLMGAELATKMGDGGAAQTYTDMAKQIEAEMAKQTQDGAIYETACCNRQKDVAAVLGVLHDDHSDPVFGVSSTEAANTVKALDEVFTAMFSINAQGAVLWGRYDGDHYAGGNPWLLACHGKAQLMYRAATELLRRGNATAEAAGAAAEAWRRVVHRAPRDRSTASLAAALADTADAVLYRVYQSVAPLGFHLPEQVSKTDGTFANVHDLTWSYASLFDALHYRTAYVAAARAA